MRPPFGAYRLPPGAWRLALLFAGATVAGAVADRLNVPLPWMLGALAFSMLVSMAGFETSPPRAIRASGQVIVASSVGLAFTPATMAVLATLILPMLLSAFATILCGFLVAAVMMRLAHMDAVSASLASVPVGPVEMANLAEQYGIPPAPVVFAQTVRIVVTIMGIPPLLIWLDGSIADPNAALRDAVWTPGGALLLLSLGIAGAMLVKRTGVANPFFIGPIAFCAAATTLSFPVTALPYAVLAAGQVMLGTSLGAMFKQDFFLRARRFIPVALLSAVLLIALTGSIGLGLSHALGEPWPVMILATAPGSVTEMALTAKILEQGVAVVTAFHLTRIFIILPMAPMFIRITARLARKYGIGPPGKDPP